MSATRAVNIGFLGIAILSAYILVAGWGFVLRLFGPTADVPLFGAAFRLGDLLGLVSGGAVGYFLWRHPKLNDHALQIAHELKKVTWPTWDETKQSTLVVIAVTATISLVLGLYDAVWAFLTKAIYGF